MNNINFDDIDVVLLDIEGTTTPIDFVFGTLFPYSSRELPSFLSDYSDREDVRADLQRLETEYLADGDKNKPILDMKTDHIAYLRWLISVDRKSPALKSIQGKIWEYGFRSGALKGVLFEDVPASFDHWFATGKRIAIYSSGSVLAQKLLFSNSTFGDLSELIAAYFDTGVGHKQEAESYRNIAKALQAAPGTILFISDVAAELRAAKQAGFCVLYSQRPGNKEEDQTDFTAISNFAEIA